MCVFCLVFWLLYNRFNSKLVQIKLHTKNEQKQIRWTERKLNRIDRLWNFRKYWILICEHNNKTPIVYVHAHKWWIAWHTYYYIYKTNKDALLLRRYTRINKIESYLYVYKQNATPPKRNASTEWGEHNKWWRTQLEDFVDEVYVCANYMLHTSSAYFSGFSKNDNGETTE